MEPFTIGILGYWAIRGVMALVDSAQDSVDTTDPFKRKEIEELASEPIYFVVAIMAKFTKLDGVVTKNEIAAVDAILLDLELNGDNRNKAISIFRKHKESVLTFRESLTAFATITKESTDLREGLCMLLMRLAHADGSAPLTALATVKGACRTCSVDYSKLERTFCEYQNLMHQVSDTAYQTLGCNRSDSFESIRRRYLHLAKTFHPDTLSGRDIPPELISISQEKFRSIKDAFETIALERGRCDT